MKRKINKYIVVGTIMIIASIVLSGCNDSKSETNSDSLTFVYNFNDVAEGFISNKADVPIDYNDNEYEFKYDIEEVEMGGSSNKALSLEYLNKNSDMFAYVFKEINSAEGIEKNTIYKANMQFDIGTNIDDEEKGEMTYVKAGLTGTLPLPEEKSETIEFNLDKGNDEEEGTDLKTLEGITKPNTDSQDYEFKSYTLDMNVTSNKDGMIYAVVGLDSKLPEKIKYYIDNVSIKLDKVKTE